MIDLLRLKPYPDEMFYSICARIHFLSGRAKVRQTSGLLFGTEEKNNHIIWPTRLESFSKNYGISIEELVNNHTIFPYYERFLSEDRKAGLLDAMIYTKGINPSAYLGQYNDKEYAARLVLCPLCVQDDMLKFGEPYWHRTHHLPGTKICYKHNIWLISECDICNNPFSFTSNKELNVVPTFCENGHSLNVIKNNYDEKLLLIATENNYLLNSDKKFSVHEVKEKFLEYAKINQYNNIQSTTILYEKLFPGFLIQFPSLFLEQIGISVINDQVKGIKKIFWKKKRVSINPIYYIILMLFFGGTINDFLTQKIKYLPFGEGPWPCLNKVCLKFKEKTIQRVELKNTKHFGKPRGVFTCNKCGFTYSRLGPDSNEDDCHIFDLIFETGELWNSKFEELLKNDVVQLREMAKELGVGEVFLRIKLRDRFGKINLHSVRMLAVKEIQRNRVIQVMKENPAIRLAEIEKMDVKVIKWLREYDREWLQATVPYTKNILSLDERKKIFLDIVRKNPNATRVELKELNKSNYVWLIQNEKDWISEYLPPRKTRKSKLSLEERREKFLKLKNEYPNATRTQLKEKDSNNYTWLKQNDDEWLNINQPAFNVSKPVEKTSLDQRREAFITLRASHPNLNRAELSRLNPSNYAYLRTRDTEWFEKYQPPLKERSGELRPRLTIDQRRALFLVIFKENPNTTPKELRKLCGSNYDWLHTNDFLWLQNYQPNIRKMRPQRIRILNKTLEQRRAEFLVIKNENPHLPREGLMNKYQSLYRWLRTNDSEWMLEQLPPERVGGFNK